MSEVTKQIKDAYEDLKLIASIVEVLLLFLSITLVVFLRRTFGERHLKTIPLIISFIGLLVLTGANSANGLSIPWLTFALLFGGLAIWHEVGEKRRVHSGEIWHSYYRGQSWGIWKRLGLTELTVQRFVEPGFVITLGVIAFFIQKGDTPALAFAAQFELSAYLVIAGIALAITEQMDYARRRDQVLDYFDKKIEEMQLQAALTRQSDELTKSCGFTVVGSLVSPTEIDEKLTEQHSKETPQVVA